MKARYKLGIVIPAANEEKSIKRFCDALLVQINKQQLNGHLYFVLDTVSQDNTLQILRAIAQKEPRVHVIFEPKNRSVVDAYIRGYKQAIKENCEWFIEMDCGFSHLPSEMHKFVSGLKQGYDCVFGIRRLWSLSYPVPLRRRMYSLGGTILSNLALGMSFTDTTSGYEAFTRKAITTILKKPLQSKGNFWHVEMRYRSKDMLWKEVFIHYEFPSVNVRSQSLKDAFQTLSSMIKERIASKRG